MKTWVSLKKSFLYLLLSLPLHGQSSTEEQKSEPSVISLADAWNKALSNHSDVHLAQNHVEQRKAAKAASIGYILPKLRLSSGYTRNFPQIETPLFNETPDLAPITRHVATLLRKNDESSAANDLEKQADLMSRRKNEEPLIINPKHQFESKLTLEVPLFDGVNFARILAHNEMVKLGNTRLETERALTVYKTAKAYISAYHQRVIFDLSERAEKNAQDNFSKAETDRKRGAITEKEFLEINAAFLLKQAERQAALIEYRARMGELALLMGTNEDFSLTHPPELLLNALDDDAARLEELALNNRAELKSLRQEARVAKQERVSYFMKFLPFINLRGDANYNSNDKGLINENFTYAISVNASISLFDGGTHLFELRQGTLRENAAEIKMRQLENEIRLKIRSRKEKIAQLSLTESATQLMAKIATNTEQSIRTKGNIKQEELLEASSRKLESEINVRKAQAELMDEKLALAFEVGLLTEQFAK